MNNSKNNNFYSDKVTKEYSDGSQNSDMDIDSDLEVIDNITLKNNNSNISMDDEMRLGMIFRSLSRLD